MKFFFNHYHLEKWVPLIFNKGLKKKTTKNLPQFGKVAHNLQIYLSFSDTRPFNWSRRLLIWP